MSQSLPPRPASVLRSRGPEAGPVDDVAVDAATTQARNSGAYWAATGEARGSEVTRRRGYVAVVGDERAGTRVLLQQASLGPAEVEELDRLASASVGPLVIEDPFSATDLDHLSLRAWSMPVMVRAPGPSAEPTLPAPQVEKVQDLQESERIVIDSFGLSQHEPYRAGEFLPPALLREPAFAVHLVRLDGRPVGTCVSFVADGWGSHYWVGTCESSRGRGVGRDVMLSSLTRIGHLPLTLTASRLGRPLYESLGYVTAGLSTWRSST